MPARIEESNHNQIGDGKESVAELITPDQAVVNLLIKICRAERNVVVRRRLIRNLLQLAVNHPEQILGDYQTTMSQADSAALPEVNHELATTLPLEESVEIEKLLRYYAKIIRLLWRRTVETTARPADGTQIAEVTTELIADIRLLVIETSFQGDEHPKVMTAFSESQRWDLLSCSENGLSIWLAMAQQLVSFYRQLVHERLVTSDDAKRDAKKEIELMFGQLLRLLLIIEYGQVVHSTNVFSGLKRLEGEARSRWLIGQGLKPILSNRYSSITTAVELLGAGGARTLTERRAELKIAISGVFTSVCAKIGYPHAPVDALSETAANQLGELFQADANKSLRSVLLTTLIDVLMSDPEFVEYVEEHLIPQKNSKAFAEFLKKGSTSILMVEGVARTIVNALVSTVSPEALVRSLSTLVESHRGADDIWKYDSQRMSFETAVTERQFFVDLNAANEVMEELMNIVSRPLVVTDL